MKIVINNCYGGFGLSDTAITLYNRLSGTPSISECEPEPERDDPYLIQVVEMLGELASRQSSKLEIVVIPDDVKWHIVEYDGMEHVAENHRTWH